MYFLSIIIPLYNEEQLVTEVIKQLRELEFPSIVHEHEIIIVDDCSTDKSFQVVSKMASEVPNMRALRHEKKSGKGSSH